MNKYFIAILMMLLASSVFGQSVGPNQVIVFQHNDFVGKSKPFTLEAGMRHKLVPTLGDFNDKVSSILVGENVKVRVFKHVHFTGKDRDFTTVKRLSDFKEFDALFQHGDLNDWISSMIIYPRSKKSPAGVSLTRGTWVWGTRTKIGDNYLHQFFPLPEQKTQDRAEFPSFSDYMNDKAEYLYLKGDVIVRVFEHANFKGQPLPFPGAGPSQDKSDYNLETYQFKNKISSLTIQAVGDEAWEPRKDAGPGGTPHRAPPAMTPHEVKVITPQKTAQKKDMNTGPAMKQQTGAVIPSKPRFELSDTDRPGNNYRNFDLAQPDPALCLEACQKESRCKAFTYVKPGVQGPKARCWLKDAVPPEKPSDCCVSGVRR